MSIIPHLPKPSLSAPLTPSFPQPRPRHLSEQLVKRDTLDHFPPIYGRWGTGMIPI
jgi:hypothetical protein